MAASSSSSSSSASLRWRLLRQYLLPNAGHVIKEVSPKISRRPNGYFGLIKCRIISSCELESDGERLQFEAKETPDVLVEYDLLGCSDVKLLLLFLKGNFVHMSVLMCAQYNMFLVYLVGLWPAEEVLTHFCTSNPAIFRGKRVIELGSGYGLAGLAIAACTDAAEVVLTDGNPQVIEYIKHNIEKNSRTFGKTSVDALVLDWCRDMSSTLKNSFDIVIAADCTFFKESHDALAHTVRGLLKICRNCQALFFNPQRDGSLSSFLQVVKRLSMNVELIERYDDRVWNLHENLSKGNSSIWPNYEPEHSYPLLSVLTHAHLHDIIGT